MASGRLASLDILRGLTVIGMIVVNAAAGLQRYPVPSWLLHSHWIGLTLADLVFPAFIFIVGVSIAVSMPAAASRLDAATARRIAARSLRLIAMGLVLTNIYWLSDPASNTLRWPGVLQRIGLVFLVVAPLHLLLTTRAICAVALGILLGYWGMCLLPVPDGTPVDLQVAGANFVAWVDRAVFGTHIYVRGSLGYDPEGLLSTLPAVAQGLLGVIAGRQLTAPQAGVNFVWTGLALIVAGILWSVVLPVSKDLWSGSYVLLTSGITLTAFGMLHRWVDVDRHSLWGATICTAFGINAIAAYVFHYLLAGMLNWKTLDMLYLATARVTGTPWALVAPIGFFLGFIAWVVLALQRQQWVIKV
jgi:predicted acyltransferase